MPLQKLPVTALDDINHRRRSRETINQILDHSFDDSKVRTPAEVAAGITPVNTAYEPGDERRYGVVADGVTDDYQALTNCYAACKAGNYDMKLMIRGTRRISSFLLWDAAVDVIGVSREDCIISADGNFECVRIDVDGEQALYENFTCDRLSGTAGGIDIYGGSRITLRRIICQNQTGHGLLLRAGNLATYQSIICRDNDASGIVINSGTSPTNPGASAWSCTWSDIDCIRNGEYGFVIAAGNSHFGLSVICQNNGIGGYECAANTNVFQVYCENNPPGGPPFIDVNLTSTSVRNITTINNASSTDSVIDNGTNNVILDCALYPTLSIANIFPWPRSSNVAGHDLLVRAGFAGAGATGKAGGTLTLMGGEAAGTAGAAAGGPVVLEGANGINGGAKGYIYVKDSGLRLTRAAAAYGGTVTPDLSKGALFLTRPNTGGAFTIAAPLNPQDALLWSITLENVSGGALGVITWNAIYKMLAFTSPNNNFRCTIWFYYDGTNHIQAFPQTVNVPL